jgi:alkanesulfonate monooxygenase SsuD/methylene tetrahydromethanopterin reductase-like flavin-dependent oxidoreductase (luciferase family)
MDPEQLVVRGWEQARKRIGQYVDAGLSKFVVRPATPVASWRGFLDQFVEELQVLEN